MKALVLQKNSQERISLQDTPIPELKAGEAKIKLNAAALNHRDQWCREGMYPNLSYPSILGSDGCGEVVALHTDTDQNWLGKNVVINPNVNWGPNPAVQSPDYHILGMPSSGTLAEYLVVPVHRLHLKPDHLRNEQAAALPLAGLTAYRALFTKANVDSGKKVLITGIGGGVALFALQFALASGAQVYVTSGQEEKIEKARKLGATFGISYRLENWYKVLKKENPYGFDVIIDSAGGKNFGEVVKLLAPAGVMVIYGTTAGPPSPIHLPRFFFSQATLKGTTMGNDQEFEEMLAFVKRNALEPVVSSIRPLEEVVSAFDEMATGNQFGKLVIKIEQD